MKKIIILLTFIFSFSIFCYTQNVTVVLNKDSVIIKDTSGKPIDTAKFIFRKFSVFVITNRNDFKDSLSYYYQKHHHDEDIEEKGEENHDTTPKVKEFSGKWGGFEFGFNNFMNNQFSYTLPNDAKLLELNAGRSWQFNCNIKKSIGLYKDIFGIVTGFGISFNSYEFNKQVIFLRDSTPIKFVLDTVNKFKRNNLQITYLTIPLLFEYQIPWLWRKNGKHDIWHISTGMIFNLKISSFIQQKTNDYETYTSRHDFDLSPVKLDATFRSITNGIGFYVNYSLTSLFEKNNGPDIHPITIGIGFYF